VSIVEEYTNCISYLTVRNPSE